MTVHSRSPVLLKGGSRGNTLLLLLAVQGACKRLGLIPGTCAQQEINIWNAITCLLASINISITEIDCVTEEARRRTRCVHKEGFVPIVNAKEVQLEVSLRGDQCCHGAADGTGCLLGGPKRQVCGLMQLFNPHPQLHPGP